MAIRTVKFELSKDISVNAINEFFRANSLDQTQVLNMGVVQKGDNTATILITYEDITAPYVVSTFPENGFSNVPVSTDIVIQMSEQVDTVQWLNTAATDIEIRKNGALLDPTLLIPAGAVTPAGGSWPSSAFTIENAVGTDTAAVYQVTLKTTIEDVLGNTMEVPYVFVFTTVSGSTGMVFKQGRLTPNATHIAQGYADITFTNPFPDDSYRIADSMISDDAIVASHTIDSGANQGDDFVVDDATTVEKQGQEFETPSTSSVEKLVRCQFRVKIGLGTPTGPLKAELYASDGAGSGLAKPTGGILATSELVSPSLIIAAYETIDFVFTDGYPLAASTKYFIVICHANGDSSNYFHVEGLSGTGTPPGNRAEYTGSWAGTATDDLWFLVKSGLSDGSPLRWDTNKSETAARVYWDFIWPNDAMIEWLAYWGAESTDTP